MCKRIFAPPNGCITGVYAWRIKRRKLQRSFEEMKMSISCSDCGRIFEESDRWTVVAESGYVLARFCYRCFNRHLSGITMPWDRVPPEVPVEWKEVYRRYRMAMAARSAWDWEVFVDGTLYRWYGASGEPGEITDIDGMGAGFRQTGESVERFIMRHAAWASRHRQELAERQTA